MELRGRREIFTDVAKITKENICEVIDEAFATHLLNATEIEYLQNYEKGKQPILDRIKEVRPEINYKAVENHATEITTFKVGYVFGSPITYVQRASVDKDGNTAEVDDKAIAILNEMMFEGVPGSTTVSKTVKRVTVRRSDGTTHTTETVTENRSGDKPSFGKVGVVICDSCGGLNKLRQGQTGICEYCGSHIQG
jgi:hypothetical protein